MSTYDEIRIAILGGGGVGKSAITIQLINGHFVDEYDPTIEDEYRKSCTVDERPALLHVLDTAGQDDYSYIRRDLVRSYDGVILVYSVASRASFEAIHHHVSLIFGGARGPCSVLLVGNKCDLREDRQVPDYEGRALASQLGCTFMETSAKARINIDEAFNQVVREVRMRKVPESGRRQQAWQRGYHRLLRLLRLR